MRRLNALTLRIHRFPHAADLPLPAYKTEGAVGMDVVAALPVASPSRLLVPGERALIPLGFALEVPDGFEAQIRGRSGMMRDKGVLGVLGTIDQDYRGEVMAILVNLSEGMVAVKRGDRIGQMVVSPIYEVHLTEVPLEALSATARGAGGFGSTGR